MWDYALIEVNEGVKLRNGYTDIAENGAFIHLKEPDTTTFEKLLAEASDDSIQMHGRLTIGNKGTFEGLLTDVRLERSKEVFTTPNVWKRGSLDGLNRDGGDSGDIAIQKSYRQVPGQQFGAGETELFRLDTSWVTSYRGIFDRIEKRDGLKK